jgi:hypothetical protein
MARRIKLDNQGNIQFFEGTGGSTNKITVQGPATLASDYTLTLPTAQASVGEFLQNNGSGVLSWASSTATLDSAYEAGQTITADVGQVEINGNGNIGLFLNQDSNHAALSVDSEATSSPLILLAPVVGNTRGDIAFGTARTSDPTTPSEGDVWFNGTDGRLRYYDGSGTQTLTTDTDTQNTLDGAYTDGQSITVDSGAVALSGSASILLDLVQSGAFAAMDVTCGTATGITAAQSNNNSIAALTKTGTGAGDVLSIENDGTGAGLLLNQDGDGYALSVDHDGSGSSDVVYINVAAGTSGRALLVENAGTGVGIRVTQSGGDHALESTYTGSAAHVAGLFNNTSSTVGTIRLVGRPSDPSSPVAGDMWYNSTGNTMKYYNGSSTVSF